jgi:hypothetical protein
MCSREASWLSSEGKLDRISRRVIGRPENSIAESETMPRVYDAVRELLLDVAAENGQGEADEVHDLLDSLDSLPEGRGATAADFTDVARTAFVLLYGTEPPELEKALRVHGRRREVENVKKHDPAYKKALAQHFAQIAHGSPKRHFPPTPSPHSDCLDWQWRHRVGQWKHDLRNLADPSSFGGTNFDRFLRRRLWLAEQIHAT